MPFPLICKDPGPIERKSEACSRSPPGGTEHKCLRHALSKLGYMLPPANPPFHKLRNSHLHSTPANKAPPPRKPASQQAIQRRNLGPLLCTLAYLPRDSWHFVTPLDRLMENWKAGKQASRYKKAKVLPASRPHVQS